MIDMHVPIGLETKHYPLNFQQKRNSNCQSHLIQILFKIREIDKKGRFLELLIDIYRRDSF